MAKKLIRHTPSAPARLLAPSRKVGAPQKALAPSRKPSLKVSSLAPSNRPSAPKNSKVLFARPLPTRVGAWSVAPMPKKK